MFNYSMRIPEALNVIPQRTNLTPRSIWLLAVVDVRTLKKKYLTQVAFRTIASSNNEHKSDNKVLLQTNLRECGNYEIRIATQESEDNNFDTMPQVHHNF
jgi:hypothetical protein